MILSQDFEVKFQSILIEYDTFATFQTKDTAMNRKLIKDNTEQEM